MRTMLVTNSTPGQFRAFMFDFLLTLTVFALCTGAFDVSSGHAFPAPPPAELVPAAYAVAAVVPALAAVAPALPMNGPAPTVLPLFAVAISTLMAINLAVVRHLRTAYASPRRRS